MVRKKRGNRFRMRTSGDVTSGSSPFAPPKCDLNCGDILLMYTVKQCNKSSRDKQNEAQNPQKKKEEKSNKQTNTNRNKTKNKNKKKQQIYIKTNKQTMNSKKKTKNTTKNSTKKFNDDSFNKYGTSQHEPKT